MASVEIKESIDRAARAMTLAEALEFYEDMANHCEVAADAIRDDLDFDA